ncbi:catalase HPII, partial [Brucella pecoris]
MSATDKAANVQKSLKIHDQKLEAGPGGDLHQLAEDKTPVMTTAQGGPVSDDLNTLKVGARGPTLIEDFHFR